MFARVFNATRKVLSRSPSVQSRVEDTRETTPRSYEHEPEPKVGMVTTRRGRETSTPVKNAPRRSTRKGTGKRQLDVDETPTSSKRRRHLVENEDEAPKEAEDAQVQDDEPVEEPDNQVFDTIAVAVPIRAKENSDSPNDEAETPTSHRASPKITVESRSVDAAPEATEENEGPSTPKDAGKVQARTSAGSKEKRDRNATKHTSRDSLPLEPKRSEPKYPDEVPSSTWESDEASITMQDSAPAPEPESRKTHMRFGSEEPTDSPDAVKMNKQGHARYEAFEALQADALMEGEDDASGSDSDEAPEMVTTATAASKAIATEKEAARAHRAQQEKEQLKRQQRAQRIAEEQAEKRKREEKEARRLQKTQAKPQRVASPLSTSLDVDINNLPALLPDSILEAAGDKRPPTPPPVRQGKTAEEIRQEKLNRHIKFLERGEKPIKDVKKGSVNVSVLAQQNLALAPKVNQNTKNIREHWLKGRRAEKRDKKGRPKVENTRMERKTISRGFLRDED
ncbi:hypothetical protein BU26DRAFT_520042 [Trematosphaeria pertusa]|uniref:Uncharacterized protein n=1 Tax=Trematosphaeria pertusa TaxID=390896 RepID=A0A6A6IFP9_9PLEO|nr:uncharacterized protein BU26DRAFT_520042 [Trematosphaeria pertusa]KAF2248343.1 hypothetical protein BU26DRAFT_520042 [Trematosphaeria pertusa]